MKMMLSPKSHLQRDHRLPFLFARVFTTTKLMHYHFTISLLILIVILQSHNCNALPSSSTVSSTEPSGTSFLPTATIPPTSTTSIKTASGTVKCHCQTIPDDATDKSTSNNGETIEIEIYKPEDQNDEDDGGDTHLKAKPVTRNSFTLVDDGSIGSQQSEDIVDARNDDDEPNSEDRAFSTEPTLYSFFSALQRSGEQQSEFVPENGDDDSAALSADMHADNHQIEVQATSPPTTTSTSDSIAYKAFRSAELSDPSQEFSSEQVHETHRPEDELWDLITGNKMANGFKKQKQEFLYLGSIIDSFKGPRRRRRRALRGTSKDSVVFVYPEGQDPNNPSPNHYQQQQPVFKEKVSDDKASKQNSSVTSGTMKVRSDATQVNMEINKQEIQRRMEEAMQQAWEDYGTKGVNAPPSLPPPVQYAAPYHNNPLYQFPPRPFLHIDRIFNPFQPMTSEWDKHVSLLPTAPPDRASMEPGLFSQFLARYMDFEINNQETADLMRKVIFGIFVGFLVVGWVALGVALGFVPLKKWIAFGSEAGTKRSDKGKDLARRDATLAQITDKILLSLDADWLKRLEERVMGSDGVAEGSNGKGTPGKKLQTQVFCCILPDEQTQGMVECQVLKKGNTKSKTTAFKCLSDLIYNFQFGPKEDGVSEEQDNVVDFKSKANNSNGEGDEELNSKNNTSS